MRLLSNTTSIFALATASTRSPTVWRSPNDDMNAAAWLLGAPPPELLLPLAPLDVGARPWLTAGALLYELVEGAVRRAGKLSSKIDASRSSGSTSSAALAGRPAAGFDRLPAVPAALSINEEDAGLAVPVHVDADVTAEAVEAEPAAGIPVAGRSDAVPYREGPALPMLYKSSSSSSSSPPPP